MRLQGVDAGWCRHWVCVWVWSLHWEERLYSWKRTWTRGCQSIVPSNTTQVPLLNTYTWKSAHPVVGEHVPPLYLVTTAHGCSIRNLFWIDHCVTWPYHICAYNVGCLTLWKTCVIICYIQGFIAMLLLRFRVHYNYRCFKSDIVRLILVSWYKPPFITVVFTTTVLAGV